MLALCLGIVVGFADPVTAIQLRYPAHRTTVVTGSSYSVYYSLAKDAPTELQRAYRLLEVAEREVLITEALQLFRAEIVANDRRLEAQKTARHMSYLNQSASPFGVFAQESSSFQRQSGNTSQSFASQTSLYLDPSLTMLVPESNLKLELSRVNGSEARVERALAAVNRMADAQYYLHATLITLAYPNDSTRPAIKKPGKLEATFISTTLTPAPVTIVPQNARPQAMTALEIATKAEETAAANEILAAEREQAARTNERAADVYYRECDAAERADARAAWIQARDEWTKAKREWESARTRWVAAHDRVETLKAIAARPAASSSGTIRAGGSAPRR